MPFNTEELSPPKGSIKNGIWQAVREIWLKDPTEFDAYVADLLGTSFAGGAGAVQGASQTYPGKPWLILANVDYEPFMDPKMGGEDHAGTPIDPKDADGVGQPALGYKFTLTYETPTFDQGTLPDPNNQDLPELPTETFLTVKVGLGIEVLALDKSGLEWASVIGGSKEVGVNTAIGSFVPTETLNLTWHRIAFPPWTNIRELRGKLNASTFLGHEAETVMFIGLDGSRQFQVNGERQWELDYKFSVKEVKFDFGGNELVAGWNHFFRNHNDPSTPQWERIFTKSSGGTKTIYKSDDLTKLFVSEAPTG